MCNQAFFTKVFIDEDNELRVEHNRPFEMLLDRQVNANSLSSAADADKAQTLTNVSVGKGSGLVRAVEAGRLSSNTWKRLERLSSAWKQAKQDGASEEPPAAEPDPRVVTNPTRRSRTPLTPDEVDEIRTARSNGESAMSIARRFEVSRMTVWEKTRERLT